MVTECETKKTEIIAHKSRLSKCNADVYVDENLKDRSGSNDNNQTLLAFPALSTVPTGIYVSYGRFV